MNYRLLTYSLAVLFCFLSCKKNNTSSKIDADVIAYKDSVAISKVTFSRITPSIPVNFDQHSFSTIEVYNDTVYLKQHMYRKGELENSVTLNKKNISAIQVGSFFEKIPQEYLNADYSFGLEDNPNDSDYLVVEIELANSKTNKIKLGYASDKKIALIKLLSDFHTKSLLILSDFEEK